jgi:hypothetical protein
MSVMLILLHPAYGYFNHGGKKRESSSLGRMSSENAQNIRKPKGKGKEKK